jgi:predicted nucleotidyltransferase
MRNIAINRRPLAAFCRRWKVAQFSLFGSVLRDDFTANSDVDVLVAFLPEARPSLFDMVRMQEELKALIGREVDLVSRRGLETSRNALRKRAILESAEVVYGS